MIYCNPLSQLEKPPDSYITLLSKRADSEPSKPDLSGVSRKALIQLLEELGALHPAIEQEISKVSAAAEHLVRTDPTKAIRQRIQHLASTDAGNVSNSHRLADLESLFGDFMKLADEGRADAFLQSTDFLIRQSDFIVDNQAETNHALASLRQCLSPLVTVLPVSSLTPYQQLHWLIDVQLEDEQGLLTDELIQTIHACPAYTYDCWETVVEQLEVRLRQRISATINSKGRRRRILALLVDVYKRVDKHRLILPLLYREVTSSQCYMLLVNALVDSGEQYDACSWCVSGYRSLSKKSPGLAQELLERWCDLCQEDGKARALAACRAQAFFEHPSLESYIKLNEAAERAGCWPSVRRGALSYLETGKRPDEACPPGLDPWPLPESDFKGARAIVNNCLLAQFPAFNKLVDIAVFEGRLDDVAGLYGQLQSRGSIGSIQHTVAAALVSSHPKLAVEICFDMASDLLADTRSTHRESHYQEAISHLTRAYELCKGNNLLSEWEQKTKNFLAPYIRRPKLYGMLKAFLQQTGTEQAG